MSVIAKAERDYKVAHGRGATDSHAMPLILIATVPILRGFDEAKAREFYDDFLRFAVDWPGLEHPDWGGMEMTVLASFHKHITFAEQPA
ncbi:MAG: glyoxalase superfamily protein [Devosia sp.]